MSASTQPLIHAIDVGIENLHDLVARTATRFEGDDSDTLARTFEPLACAVCTTLGFSPDECWDFHRLGTGPAATFFAPLTAKQQRDADVEECFAKERAETAANSRFVR